MKFPNSPAITPFEEKHAALIASKVSAGLTRAGAIESIHHQLESDTFRSTPGARHHVTDGSIADGDFVREVHENGRITKTQETDPKVVGRAVIPADYRCVAGSVIVIAPIR